jgi:hypothetical protein
MVCLMEAKAKEKAQKEKTQENYKKTVVIAL